MLDSLFAALAAFGTLLTAYFMLPTFLSSVPFLRLSVSDTPQIYMSQQEATEGERLQQKVFFPLYICIEAPPNHSISLKTLEVRGGSIPKGIADKYGNISDGDVEHLVKGPVPFRVPIPYGQDVRFQVLVLPDTPESGELEVIVRYGFFRKIRRLVPYHRGPYFFQIKHSPKTSETFSR